MRRCLLLNRIDMLQDLLAGQGHFQPIMVSRSRIFFVLLEIHCVNIFLYSRTETWMQFKYWWNFHYLIFYCFRLEGVSHVFPLPPTLLYVAPLLVSVASNDTMFWGAHHLFWGKGPSQLTDFAPSLCLLVPLTPLSLPLLPLSPMSPLAPTEVVGTPKYSIIY